MCDQDDHSLHESEFADSRRHGPREVWLNDPEQTLEMENQLAVFEISNDVMNNTIWNLVSPHTHEVDSGK